MDKINTTIKVHVQIFVFFAIWIAVLIVTDVYSPFDLVQAAKEIPQAISIYVVLGIIFTKYVWKWPILQGWLIKIPVLQGTWVGELKSDWVNPETQKGIDPIPIVLVIRQTYLAIRITLMTQESSSYSTTADINTVTSGDELYLVYNYTNRPKATIRDRSAIHDGAATLKIVRTPKRILEGEYWTNRKTRGEIRVQFKSKKIAEQFESA